MDLSEFPSHAYKIRTDFLSSIFLYCISKKLSFTFSRSQFLDLTRIYELSKSYKRF